MKRLKFFLLQMENNTTTYNAMYEGRLVPPPPEDAGYDATYWKGDVSVRIEATNKLAKDKPTLVWQIPVEKLGIEVLDETSAADFCLRQFKLYIDELNGELYNRKRTDKENGKYYICEPGGEILIRNSSYFAICPQKGYENRNRASVHFYKDGIVGPPKLCLCIRMMVQLPKGKLRKTIQMLCKDLPEAVIRFIDDFDVKKINEAMEAAIKQNTIRKWLSTSEYCAFIANGSILPRAKGMDLPLMSAVPFRAAAGDEIEVCGLKGMGIRRGVTVITGGGYSGKSTLLDAISAGIYNHIIGDGREFCITDERAMTISAEDGRSVKHENISPFIKWLPGGDTADFSTEHASGSTSQAANIMEAVDYGARLLLIDEDRSATNFMIRDAMMKELIKKEPITPFTDRVKELYHEKEVSTILVIGGSGEYLSVADRIYMMEDYEIKDVTEISKNICKDHEAAIDLSEPTVWSQSRALKAEGFTSYPEGSGSEVLKVYDLGFMLRNLEISNNQDEVDIKMRVDELYEKIEREGLDTVYYGYFTECERFLELPRKQELFGVIDRMRKTKVIKA